MATPNVAKTAPAAKAPAAKSAPVAKATVTTTTEPKAQRNDTLRNVLLVVLATLLIALLVLGIIWLSRQISTPPSGGTGAGGNAAAAPVGYVCNAVTIGAPTKSEGQCSNCTINYTKPGEVYIVGKTPMEYKPGAWVFQYNTGNDDGFNACIKDQDFMSDPNYQPIWK